MVFSLYLSVMIHGVFYVVFTFMQMPLVVLMSLFMLMLHLPLLCQKRFTVTTKLCIHCAHLFTNNSFVKIEIHSAESCYITGHLPVCTRVYLVSEGPKLWHTNVGIADAALIMQTNWPQLRLIVMCLRCQLLEMTSVIYPRTKHFIFNGHFYVNVG